MQPSSDHCLLWLRRDLRLADSPAAREAFGYPRITVAYLDDGNAAVAPTPVRQNAIANALSRIGRTTVGRACTVRRVSGLASDEIPRLAAEVGAGVVVTNHAIGDAQEWADERACAKILRSDGVRYDSFAHDAIRRGSRRTPQPFLTPLKTAGGPGRPDGAQRRLGAFLDRLAASRYAQDMWRPGPDRQASSQMSLDLAIGTLAGDRVLHETAIRAERAVGFERACLAQLAARLQWRIQFRQLYEDNTREFPSGPESEETPDAARHLALWRSGATGVPLIDATMRDLAATGWVNFRLRQTVASFALDLLGLDPWHVGMVLASVFNDYDPAIHWPQIMLQAGKLAPERGPRVINPIKQGRDLDADESYVRHWSPELASVPAGFGHEPWRHPAWRGPPPMIDLIQAAIAARKRHGSPRPSSDQQTRLL